ncbi:hypothetical protein NDU88_003369 [Pleurodeles waltl]|uniref:Uncharacterized protein n=1 Tax=Pleurodeles waltl TaxID=8319 RepID=A0AAV7NL93_PLEWA|nr:hypothetical protein NDU88_003369 [Pleurodeles waltl]
MAARQCKKDCSWVDGTTTSTSDKSCSRGRANSVSSYLDDRGAGVTNENPDFRVLRREKSEDGRGVERDAEREDAGPEREEEEKAPGTPKGNPEEPNPTKKTGERGSPEAGGETPSRCHVPGGTWLAKVELF